MVPWYRGWKKKGRCSIRISSRVLGIGQKNLARIFLRCISFLGWNLVTPQTPQTHKSKNGDFWVPPKMAKNVRWPQNSRCIAPEVCPSSKILFTESSLLIEKFWQKNFFGARIFFSPTSTWKFSIFGLHQVLRPLKKQGCGSRGAPKFFLKTTSWGTSIDMSINIVLSVLKKSRF